MASSYVEAEVGQLGLTRAPPDVRGMIRGPNGRPRADLGLGGLMVARQASARNAWEATAAATRGEQAALSAKPASGVRALGGGGAPPGSAAPAQAPAVAASTPLTLAVATPPPPLPAAGPSSLASPGSVAITDALGEALGRASFRLEAVDRRLDDQDGSLSAATAKLDTLSLRLGSQDQSVKQLAQSVAALRLEYSTISQATDGQSGARLDTLDRSLGQLLAGFQAFSARAERDIDQLQREAETTRGAVAALAEDAAGGDALAGEEAYRAAVVLNALTGLPPLTPIQLRGTARVGDGGVFMDRQSYDLQRGLVDVPCLAELADGTPCIAFV